MGAGYTNVIVIALDTLRDDYSGPIDSVLKRYGFSKLPNVVSPSPWTLPSHASMFTGAYPATHGAHATKNLKIPDIRLKARRLLTHDMREMGYHTYLFTANDYVRPFFGFRGFDSVVFVPSVPIIQDADEDRERWAKFKGRNALETGKNMISAGEFKLLAKYTLKEFSRKMRPVSKFYYSLRHNWPLNKGVSRFIEYMRNSRFEEPFFLFVNLMEMHEPYTVRDKGTWRMLANPSIDERIIRRWRSRYPAHAK